MSSTVQITTTVQATIRPIFISCFFDDNGQRYAHFQYGLYHDGKLVYKMQDQTLPAGDPRADAALLHNEALLLAAVHQAFLNVRGAKPEAEWDDNDRRVAQLIAEETQS